MERRIASAPLDAPSADALATLECIETLEWIERRAVQSLHCSASRAVRQALGLKTLESGPLLGAFAPALDILSLNRVLGLGLATDSPDPAAGAAGVEEALAMARRSGAARVFLPVVPTPLGARAEAALEGRGVPAHNRWVRLSLRLDQGFHTGYPGTREGRPELRVLDRSMATAYGALVAECFGMPAAAGALFAGPVGFPGWTHVGAFWNGEFAGAGALYAEGSAAWLSFGAVRPAFRNRGIHLALLGERLRAAREAGCALASTETADWSLGRPSPSMRNLLRLGFEPRYRRPNRLVLLPS